MTTSTYSNLFENTPLTAVNLQRVVADMMSMSERPLAIQPDTIIMPPKLYSEYLEMLLHAAEYTLKHALKVVGRAILSGHYEKRQRQRRDGVAAYRLRRRRGMAAQLPRLHEVVSEARATLSAWQEQHKPRHSVDWATTDSSVFFTTPSEVV